MQAERQWCQFRCDSVKFFIHDSSSRINVDRKFKEAPISVERIQLGTAVSGHEISIQVEREKKERDFVRQIVDRLSFVL